MVIDDLKKDGYNKEEEYFYKLNQELLLKRRAELDQTKTAGSKGAFWMVCPKCGGSMHEIDKSGIKIDECTACGGIYFDRGELDLLIEAKESHGFLGLFRKKK